MAAETYAYGEDVNQMLLLWDLPCDCVDGFVRLDVSEMQIFVNLHLCLCTIWDLDYADVLCKQIND